jgi:hypothetical protein
MHIVVFAVLTTYALVLRDMHRRPAGGNAERQVDKYLLQQVILDA